MGTGRREGITNEANQIHLKVPVRYTFCARKRTKVLKFTGCFQQVLSRWAEADFCASRCGQQLNLKDSVLCWFMCLSHRDGRCIKCRGISKDLWQALEELPDAGWLWPCLRISFVNAARGQVSLEWKPEGRVSFAELDLYQHGQSSPALFLCYFKALRERQGKFKRNMLPPPASMPELGRGRHHNLKEFLLQL